MSHTHTTFRNLPLRELLVFEAAARRGTMVAAAEELGMTQGGVSRHVKALEERLQETLFRRGSRGLVLTEAGDLLASYVERGLSEIAAGVQRLWQPQGRVSLEVTCSRTLALRVLAPRVSGFVRQHPWIDLRINTHRYYAELGSVDVTVGVRLGSGNWPGQLVSPLTQEVLFPVCTPAYLAGLPGPGAAEALRGAILLHYLERPHWANWLAAAGLPGELGMEGPRFSEMAMALAAAEAGQGIAIARRIHVAEALAAGRLVRPFAAQADDGEGYYLVMTPAAQARSTVRAFVTWLNGEIADLTALEAPGS